MYAKIFEEPIEIQTDEVTIQKLLVEVRNERWVQNEILGKDNEQDRLFGVIGQKIADDFFIPLGFKSIDESNFIFRRTGDYEIEGQKSDLKLSSKYPNSVSIPKHKNDGDFKKYSDKEYLCGYFNTSCCKITIWGICDYEIVMKINENKNTTYHLVNKVDFKNVS